MLATQDWAGIAAVIAAIGASTSAVIAAIANVRVGHVRDQVSTNGDPRTLGQIAQDVAGATGVSHRAGEEQPPQ